MSTLSDSADDLSDDLNFDVDQATRLMRGEIALTHEHLYFAWGDIYDVYIARACENDADYVFHLIKCNPLDENDLEQDLAERKPTVAVRHNGKLDLFDAEGNMQPTSWNVRSLYPFGPKQLEWFAATIQGALTEN